MFVKSDIRKIGIALEKTISYEIYRGLGEAGIIHLLRMQNQHAVMDAGLTVEESLTREILAGIEYVLDSFEVEPEMTDLAARPRDIRHDAAFVAGIRKTLERLKRLHAEIQAAADKVSEHIAAAQALQRFALEPRAIQSARLIRMVFGTVSDRQWQAPETQTFVLIRQDEYVIAASLCADAPALLKFLGDHGFTDLMPHVSRQSLADLQHRAASLARRSAVLEGYRNRLREQTLAAIMDLYGFYDGYAEILKAMRCSAFSARAMFITGYLDVHDKERLIGILKAICGDRYVLSEERDRDAPVRLINIRLLKPFELLVKTMGMPANSEIDPTPLTALTFVVMFALMFGDLGQGLVLAAIGVVLKYYAHKKGRESMGAAGGILVVCGLAAAACGLLYGSVFSSEHLIPALWFHPMERILDLFSATILLGVVFICAGLGVNIINALINRDYPAAFFEKRGLSIFVLYTAVVLLAIRSLYSGRIPAPWEAGIFVLAPLLIFTLRGVLGPLLFQAPRPPSVAEYVIETIMEIVEICLSLFANTISFIRIGAFALAHAGLSIVTYTLAALADPSLNSVAAITIIVIGNIFIIAFEGLVCGIQSLRLEYYEFFGKFFKGDGVAFAPFTLKAKVLEV